ncbi:BTB/POZ domain-containing protein At2g04740 isoform X2 [Salvia hispanica]|uniref:BTB/POZ domain-containing protein At2g04740 isoform X2 n=1 Tax=Salvia hispanica TaxID=49212 RepID=UPI0020099F0E|nr:BTB/POZ domain-containing protein At2g04740 isoform X2 [Salvia hispanica]
MLSELDDIDLEAADFHSSLPLKKVPYGDIFEASRAGDVGRLRYLLESGVNVNARDQWDSVALYYACLAGHLDAARMLLESGAICSEHTFDGDRCHYAALNLKVRKLLKSFEARPPPLQPLQAALRDTFFSCQANHFHFNFTSLLPGHSSQGESSSSYCPPDIVFYVQGRPLEAHRLILAARSPFFNKKFQTDWKQRNEGISLPEEDRLPAALNRILQISLANSPRGQGIDTEDLADVCVRVEDKIFRCHRVILASRSEYFKARLSRIKDFIQGTDPLPQQSLPCLDEHDLNAETFQKMIEYMYTDGLVEINPDQAEEMFDAASRYLLFPLKRPVADALLPQLEMVSPAELCHWLLLADMYGVLKIREYCLDAIALNFETFAETREFRAMLLTLPPPSGDSSLRTTAPSAPGAEVNVVEGNILDDLREKWLEAEGAELDKRDESALLFDKRLDMLMLVAKQEKSVEHEDNVDSSPETLSSSSVVIKSEVLER